MTEEGVTMFRSSARERTMASDGAGKHTYRVTVEWTGNRGTGTSDYRAG